ncbi:MAG: serine/threonine-protein phosphatase [Phycisphaerae bacterium]|nr:serine/threonine-protein phosphatase [Phycisphaerae bacterium]
MSGLPTDERAVRTDSDADAAVRYAVVDVSQRERLPILTEMMRSVSMATTPAEVQVAFGRGMRRVRGVDGYLATSVRDLPPGVYKVTRNLLQRQPSNAEPPNPWRDWPAIPESRGGFLGEIMDRQQPTLVQRMRVDDDPVFGDQLREFGSMMAIPLWDGGKILNWGFFLAKRPDAFDAEILEEFVVSTNLVGGTVRNVIANQKLADADRAKTREIERIAALQRALLPSPLPTIPGVSIGAHYATFGEAGGDVYAIREVRVSGNDEPHWLLLIADASGHGPSAAVVSAMVDAIFSTVPEPIEGPAAILATLNDYLAVKKVEHAFVTAFLGLYRPSARTLRYARAGHNPPIVRSPGGNVVRLLEDVGDVPLGIMTGIRYEEAVVTLAPLETLVLYTDGITEARDPSGTMFGIERVEESLRVCTGAPDCAVHHITTHLLAFEAGVRPGDDQTLMVMQVDAATAGGSS